MIGAFFFIGDICLAQAPHQVGGFVLGKDIADYKEMVRMETSLPIRHMEYLREVEIKETEGFKSGLICYGTCEVPGRIVRIKLSFGLAWRQSLAYLCTCLWCGTDVNWAGGGCFLRQPLCAVPVRPSG